MAGQCRPDEHPIDRLRAQRGAAGAASLYVHVPFCAHKCHYCDFYSLVDTRDRQDAFIDRLIEELGGLPPLAGPLATVFVGGGTPTLLRPDLWRRLLAAMHDRFDLASAEFTVECNPETASPDLFAVLAAGGVNRISIGAQSFDERHLRTLERRHDPANVERSIRLARDAGIARQSVDLIFAIPGQTMDDWRRDLGRLLDLGVTHASCYALTYEPNTAMTARLGRGEFESADDDLEADMLQAAIDRLGAAGLQRYEVSNFAAPGHECRHNLAYWRQDDWLAAGPSASGHLRGWRWKNAPRLDTYLARRGPHGTPPAVDVEPPDANRAAAERLMTGLRLREGIDPAWIATDLDQPARERLDAAYDALVRDDLAQRAGGRVMLKDAGLLRADGIAADLMALL